jgi:hypothetical protein
VQPSMPSISAGRPMRARGGSDRYGLCYLELFPEVVSNRQVLGCAGTWRPNTP